VLSTLLFGLWHFGLAMSATNGNILAAIAFSIALPGMVGLWFAILFVRMRNLLVPVVFHSLIDVVGLGA
jgi:membrane protease YdiL (CAAX protease family)